MFRWSGEALGSCIYVFLSGNEVEKAYNIIKKLDLEQHNIIGHPKYEISVQFMYKLINIFYHTLLVLKFWKSFVSLPLKQIKFHMRCIVFDIVMKLEITKSEEVHWIIVKPITSRKQ